MEVPLWNTKYKIRNTKYKKKIQNTKLDHTYGGSSLNLLLFHLHQSDMCGKFRVQICFNDVWFSAVSKGARLSICGHWSWNSLSLKDTMYWGQPVPGQWRSSDSFWYHQAITEIFGVFTECAFSLIWVSCHLFWIPKNSSSYCVLSGWRSEE